MDFTQLALPASLVEGLQKVHITKPTLIQEKGIPPILANRDVIGQSGTGTGKTLAYLLPVLQKINTNQREAQAVILTPTHELAIQVQRVIEMLAKESGMDVQSVPIIGNVNLQRQVEQLKKKPQIVVGSPGRILELITMRKIKAHTVKTIVADEADRLLDDENLEVVEAIIKTTQRDRQLLFFSATITPRTLEIGKALMKDPEVIQIRSEVPVPEQITHMYFLAEPRDKFEALRKIYAVVKPEKSIVFINQSYEIEKTVAKLQYHGLHAEGIHGSSGKQDRKKVMDDFRAGRVKILVASDLAARGLDLEGVTHIFNLDLPEDPHFYLHRAGRTGRMGKSGVTISIVSPFEENGLHKYEKLFGIQILAKEVYAGRISDVRPQGREKSSSPKAASTRKADSGRGQAPGRTGKTEERQGKKQESGSRGNAHFSKQMNTGSRSQKSGLKQNPDERTTGKDLPMQGKKTYRNSRKSDSDKADKR